MKNPEVRVATTKDSEKVTAALAIAFSSDPVVRSFYPNPLDHLNYFSQMTRIHLDDAIVSETAYYVEGFQAAAIWFPPAKLESAKAEQEKREKRLKELMKETVSREGNEDLFTALGQLQESHPDKPHWYLHEIGVDPYHQNEGLGSVLMKYALPKCDADGIFSYLESSNPLNVPFYERHGYEVMKVIQVGTSPTFTLMAREPR